MPKSLLHMFSSRSFMILVLAFQSLIHFEFILVYCFIKQSSFFFLHVSVQFPQHCLLKWLSLPHCIFLLPLSHISWPYRSGLPVPLHWSVFLVLWFCIVVIDRRVYFLKTVLNKNVDLIMDTKDQAMLFSLACTPSLPLA